MCLSFILCIALLILSGCSLNLDTSNITPSPHKLDHRILEVEFVDATKFSKNIFKKKKSIKYNEDVSKYVNQSPIAVSVIQAIEKAEINGAERTPGAKLFVHLEDYHIPPIGLGFKSSTLIRYEIINDKYGNTLLNEPVSSEGFIPFSNHLVATVRAKRSLEQSINKNIEQFIYLLKDYARRKSIVKNRSEIF